MADENEIEQLYQTMLSSLPPDVDSIVLLGALTHLSALGLYSLLKGIMDTGGITSEQELLDVFTGQISDGLTHLVMNNPLPIKTVSDNE